MLIGFNAVAVGIADPLPELFLDLCSMNYFIFWTKLFQLFRVAKTCHYGFQKQNSILGYSTQARIRYGLTIVHVGVIGMSLR